MTSVALINLPSPFLINDEVMPPLGLMYLSSYLKSKGIKTEIIDFATRDVHESDLKGYDIYAYTSTTPQYPYAISPKWIKKLNPESTVVIGGAHAMSFGKQCRSDGFDCVVSGEGENALLYISKFVESKKKINNKLCGIIKSKQISDIDSIPFPDRNFKGFKKYIYKINGKLSTTMITSRGCPFNCYFCCKTWQGVRLRSSYNIIKEVETIKNMGFEGVMFYDDTFTIDKNRTLDICEGMKKFDMIWRCFIHANTVDKKLLETMHNSGCREVGIGVESGSLKILKTINKKIDLNKVIQICDWCHEIGLKIKTFLIIGLPGESIDTINETIKFLKTATPDNFDYSIYTPFPNTKIWDKKEENSESFDILFDKNTLDYEKMFYKGMSGKYKAQISTSLLTSEEIEKYRDYVDIEIRKKLFRKT